MKRVFASLFLLGILLTGCSSQRAGGQTTADEPVSGTVFAMDTVMNFTIYGDEDLLTVVEEQINELDAMLSVTDAGSEIYAVNRDGYGTLSADAAGLLDRGLELCARTGGALDLSIYPVVRAWGFTNGDYGVPEAETLEALLSHVDYSQIAFDAGTGAVTLAPEMQIDLGSVAKGYTGDQITALLREHGVTSALLNLGGNVQALGSKPDGSPWRVAVQDPLGNGYLGVLEIEDHAVITSGGYERYFVENGETYWHIIDPLTGAPARNGLVSVTIVGDSGLLCDGLSTALFVMGLDRATEFWQESGDFDVILVTENGQIAISERLQDKFSLLGEYEEVTVMHRDENVQQGESMIDGGSQRGSDTFLW